MCGWPIMASRLNLIYTGEVFGNPAGGRSQGSVYDGLLELGVDVDFAKLVGWQGATFHVNAYDIHGPSGTDKYVQDFGRFSNIDYYDSIRSVRVVDRTDFPGRQVLDPVRPARGGQGIFRVGRGRFVHQQRFRHPANDLGEYAGANLRQRRAGRARARSPDRGALFSSCGVRRQPRSRRARGSRRRVSTPARSYNRNGIKINLNSKEGAFSIYELGYRLNHEKDAKGLPGSYKLGGWYHTDTFSDLRSDRNGRSLADPSSDGIPRAISGNWGGYLVIDQMLYRPATSTPPTVAGGKDARGGGEKTQNDTKAAPAADVGDKGLTAFLRISGAPGDRNPISFYLDAGFSYKGLLPTRDKDLLGIAASYSRFGDSERAFDRDQSFFSHVGAQPHDEEVVIEGSYQAILKPYWSVQPDLQVIVHPGGSSQYADALVSGVRSVVTF